ncbi:MAG: DUF3096 domain-containing protein [Gammaproteobacteria bacterium]|nr:DUF3096 domain-containing protein [Gammaproteobacteria bacterium]
MSGRNWSLAVTLALALVPAAASARAGTHAPVADHADLHLSHGRFHRVAIYQPAGTPRSFVLFLSGDGGWNLGVVSMAQALAARGALVAGINTPRLLTGLEHDPAGCEFLDGDLENLSHFLQAYFRLPSYLSPVIVGYSSGATLAYAMMVQAPKGTFAGALSLGFCPDLELHKPLCKGEGLHYRKRADGRGVDFLPGTLNGAWISLNGAVDQVCPIAPQRRFIAQVPGAGLVELPHVGHGFGVPKNWMPQFTAAFNELSVKTPRPAPPPISLSDLPIVTVAVPHGVPRRDLLALLMTGDGGWAGLDRDLAGALAAAGVPVVALDSLRYYWRPRTPDQVAADTDRILRHYLAAWRRRHAVIVGYSQGADMVPFVLSRLPPATARSVTAGVSLGMSQHALFEFHLRDWVGGNEDVGPSTVAEADRIDGIPFACVYGADDADSGCPRLDPRHARIIKTAGGHHFGGDYAQLAMRILAIAGPLPPQIVPLHAGATSSAKLPVSSPSWIDSMLTLHIALAPLLALIAGILILLRPKLLNYVVAIYLIAVGLLGLVHWR